MNYIYDMNIKAKIKHFKEILNKGLCESLIKEREQDYYELMELFKNHPDYPDKLHNVIDIKIEKNPRNKKYFAFYLIKNDRNIDNISYLACINKPNLNKDINSALRDCIETQISNFKRSLREEKCLFCDNANDIQIDHIVLFRYLVDDFLTNKAYIPNLFDDHPIYHYAIFKQEDKQFANEWYEYHLHNAKLRPLCKKCNLTRSKV